MTNIHKTAIISESANIAKDVAIGPYCVIGDNVTLGEGCRLHSHVVISGYTKIGARNEIFPFASLGLAPQDLKYKGEASELIIGNDNIIREHVTMNIGTSGGGMKTIIGNNCLFMTAAHVAHDCKIGNNVIMANNATLAGHVEIGDYVIIGGLSAVHQFVRIGNHAMIGGMSGVEHDVIPFGSVMGERANLAGLNLVGLKRRGFERDSINALRSAYKMMFEEQTSLTLAERASQVEKEFGKFSEIMEIISFMNEKGSRSLCIPKEQAA